MKETCFSNTLKGKREKLGYSEAQLANLLTMTLESYGDIESHEDEWRTVPPFYQIRFLAIVLNIDLLDHISETDGHVINTPAASNELLRKRRKELAMNEIEFSDKCGFVPSFCTIVEAHEGIILYPIAVTEIVCRTLEIEQRSFVKNCMLVP